MALMKVTELQADILMHRLECTDILSEVLEADESDVYRAFMGIKTGLDAGVIAKPASDLAAEMLVEALEGSTYIAAMEAVESNKKIAAVQKSFDSLVKKVETLTGKTVSA